MNVQETSGASNLISYGITPILTIDVWEHGE
jgi:superoxide dismutase